MSENLDYVQMSRDGIEVFLDIPGYEGLYQVSNLGRVKSFPNKTHKNTIILTNKLNWAGYHTVSLSKNKKLKHFRIHKLVSMAFLGHIPDGGYNLVINHIDYDRLNNKLYNLEIVTTRYNNSHKYFRQKTSSVYTGVSWVEERNAWRAAINIDKNKFSLGNFKKEKDASDIYNLALLHLENGTFNEFYKNLNIGKTKKVLKKDLDDNLICQYNSLTQASLENGILMQAIQSCCVGRSKTSGGFKWLYADQD